MKAALEHLLKADSKRSAVKYFNLAFLKRGGNGMGMPVEDMAHELGVTVKEASQLADALVKLVVVVLKHSSIEPAMAILESEAQGLEERLGGLIQQVRSSYELAFFHTSLKEFQIICFQDPASTDAGLAASFRSKKTIAMPLCRCRLASRYENRLRPCVAHVGALNSR